MQPLDTVYLQILKNLCTDSSEPIHSMGWIPLLCTVWQKNIVHFLFFCLILNSSHRFPG